MATAKPLTRTHEMGPVRPLDEVFESLHPVHEAILARRGGVPFTREEIEALIDEARGHHADADID